MAKSGADVQMSAAMPGRDGSSLLTISNNAGAGNAVAGKSLASKKKIETLQALS